MARASRIAALLLVPVLGASGAASAGAQPLGVGSPAPAFQLPALDWLRETPVSFPVLSDADSRVSAAYHVEGMPNTVILDRKGTVRYVHRSYVPGTEDEYLDQVRQLIRE